MRWRIGIQIKTLYLKSILDEALKYKKNPFYVLYVKQERCYNQSMFSMGIERVQDNSKVMLLL